MTNYIQFVELPKHTRNITKQNMPNSPKICEDSNCSDTEKAFRSRMAKLQQIKGQMNTNQGTNILKHNSNSTQVKCYQPKIIYDIFSLQHWVYSYFYTEYLDSSEKLPHLFGNSDWTKLEDFHEFSEDSISQKGIEIRNIMLKSVFCIDYPSEGIEIDLNVQIKGEASFWLFTRSKFEDQETSVNYSKTSTVMELSKMKNSTNSFVSFGTFLGSDITLNSFNPNYKIFFKRQLINYSIPQKQPRLKEFQGDICEYRIIFIDRGNDEIKAKIFVGNSTKENDVMANYYYPTEGKLYLMFAGGGDSIKLQNAKCKVFNNELLDNSEYTIVFNLESKKCSCCNLF